MSQVNEFVSSSVPSLGSSQTTESGRAALKILSETLRPPPQNVDQQAWTKRPFPKVNKRSPRGSLQSGRPKAGLSSFYSSYHTDSSSRFPFVRDGPPKAKSTNSMQNSGGHFRGAGGGDNFGGDGCFQTQSQPDPTIPTPKNCHLSNVLRSAKRCLQILRRAKDSLSRIVAEDDQLARGIKKSNPTENHLLLSHVALNVTNLCREAFVPAHRLNQTALALYSAEDFLRYPSDIRTFNMHTTTAGRIKLPDMTFNTATVIKLRQVVDLAAETYNNFSGRGALGEELREILFMILQGYQDFYAATLGCQEIFKVLLYTGPKDKAHLQQFLLALPPVERSDLLVEIQDLRRILDEIVIFLEKMSWGSFMIYRLAGGENAGGVASSVGEAAKSNGGLPTYPAYPLLRAKGPPKKKPPITEDNIEPSHKLDMKPPPGPPDPSLFHNSSSTGSTSNDFERTKGKAKSKFSRRNESSTTAILENMLVGDSRRSVTQTQTSRSLKKRSDASLNSSNAH